MPSEAPTEKAAPKMGADLVLHPIHLEFVAVRELTLKTNKPASKSYELSDGQFVLGGSVSPVGKDRKFQASVSATIGNPEISDPALPLYLKVDLVGGFAITRDDITDEQATNWAAYAAKFTLVPYLREQVAGLSGRAGFTPLMIPLLQLPVPANAHEAAKQSTP